MVRMMLRGLLVLLAVVAVGACKKAPEKVVVTETRELTDWDKPKTLLIPLMPGEWRQVPGTQLRLFNYRFGKDGEVYVSNARGGVLPNANRWLGQFGQQPLASVEGLQALDVLGVKGVLIEAKGAFGGGMGKPSRENAALLGVIVDFGQTLITVKMIGDANEVEAERNRLIQFCETLRFRGQGGGEAH